jgi:hypothetical protein
LGSKDYGFYLPKDFTVKKDQLEDNKTTVISTKYRGDRYGFA